MHKYHLAGPHGGRYGAPRGERIIINESRGSRTGSAVKAIGLRDVPMGGERSAAWTLGDNGSEPNVGS